MDRDPSGFPNRRHGCVERLQLDLHDEAVIGLIDQAIEG